MRTRRLHGPAHLAVAVALAGGGLGWAALSTDSAPTPGSAPSQPVAVEAPGGVFSSALLHVAFEEDVSEADAAALARGLGYAVASSSFEPPRVVAYEAPAATERRLRALEARADVERVVVHDWRAEARAAAEGAPPADGLCIMRINQQNQVEVVFRSGTAAAAALAAVARAGLDDGEWDPSPQTMTLQVPSASQAGRRLEQAPGVRWTALTTQLALAE